MCHLSEKRYCVNTLELLSLKLVCVSVGCFGMQSFCIYELIIHQIYNKTVVKQ